MTVGQCNRYRNLGSQKGVLILFCLALFVFVHVVSVHAGIHKLFHNDADSADHQCIATLLASGHLIVIGDVDAPSPNTIEICHYHIILQKFSYSSFDNRWQPERAPPLFFM